MGADGDPDFSGHKAHRQPKKGKKSDKKGAKDKKDDSHLPAKLRNPKAFAINSVVRAERKFRRAQDHETKKDRVPLVDRTPVEAPPFIVAVVGPPKVGKSTLLANLIRNYTRQNLSDARGPVTIVTGKKRRLTFIECNNDIHSMIDVAKVADLALLLVDASFGFEMEVFEFLNICQVHGFPQIMGVLTHLDQFRNKKKLKKTKKTLKHRFWTEVYPGAKLFYLSGYFPMTNTYPKNEVHNLARFISVMKFRSTVWRSEHAYIVADRMEDLTSGEKVRQDAKTDRKISLYGWIHGTFLKKHVSVHVPGLGDFTPDAITALPDPCPLPLKERVLRRTLNEREKVMYAPFSGVGGLVYDQDAVYIDLGGSHSHNQNQGQSGEQRERTEGGGGNSFVEELRDLKTTLDAKMESAGLQLFSASEAMTGAEMEVNQPEEEKDEGEEGEEEGINRKFTPIVSNDDGRIRRRVVFNDDEEEDVTETISKEIASLKAKAAKMSDGIDASGVGGKKRRSSDDFGDDSSEDDNNSENEDSESEDEESSGNKAIIKKNLVDSTPRRTGDESISSLVNRIKSQVQNQKGGASGVAAAQSSLGAFKMATPQQVEFDEDDVSEDDASSDEDDALSLPSDEDEDDDEEMEEDSESEDEEVNQEQKEEIEKQVVRGSVESSLEREKASRHSLAEEAFYSRFHHRSIQKMIYDDTEDYLNVSSRADFDLANFSQSQPRPEDSESSLKELFIGGDYAETAQKLLDADDDDGFGDSDEEDGDFEELDKDPGEGMAQKKNKVGGGGDELSQKSREELKKKLKEKFDMDYDGGGKNGEEGEEDGDKAFYRDWKAQVDEQSKINRTFFGDIEDSKLLEDLQGLPPGTYVRIELSSVPSEFVTMFDPQRCCPLIVGSLDSPNQETLAVVQARVKKHRWHPKILKTRDPIILSVGWRRFQTLAFYSVQDHNMRNRMIKYTPDHLHCIANFYGPMTPQGTGILGLAPSGFQGFRITLTGTVLDMDKSSELVKKLKLVGNPVKIFKKSAFIQGMFSSQLEVAKFVGAKIKTVSGIRGVIKKELRTPLGAFRATFEDKIVQSDIVFCRTWARVEVSKFFLNLPTLITATPRVMKTVGELKREAQIHLNPNPDSLYTPVERTEKHFRPLKVPKSLQGRLPYKEKPKTLAKLNEPKRIAVIKDPQERQMTQFIRTLKTRMGEKERKEKVEKDKKKGEREKVLKKVGERFDRREKELRKKVFRTLGQMNKKEELHGSGASGGSSRGRGGGRGGRGGRGGGRGRGASRPHKHQRN